MSYTHLFAALGQAAALVYVYYVGHFIWIHFLRASSLPRYLERPAGTAAYALVTGASDGIGLETATELLRRGFDVILHGRNEAKLDGLVASLKQCFPERDVRRVVADATNTELSASKLVTFVKNLRHEKDAPNGSPMLKVVVNNLGGGTRFSLPFTPLHQLEAVHVRDTVGVNAVFPTQLMRELLPVIYEDSPACVLNISTLAPLGIGQPYVSPYGGSKAYLREFAAALGQEAMATGHDVEFLALGVGDVPTAGNKTAAHNVMTVAADEMARNILDKVGSDSSFVAANWKQHAGVTLASLLPTSVMKKMLRAEMDRRRTLISKIA